MKKTGDGVNCAHSVCAISRVMGKAFGIDDYEKWMISIKERIQRSRVRASMLVNSEQTLLYWDVGHEILEKQNNEGWGAKVVERMSADLKATFPDMKGWSRSNLMYMRQFAEAWTRKEIVQAPLGQLPWYHHIALLECLKSRGDRIAYAALALENGWSRNVMVHQIELGAADLHGTAITNFKNGGASTATELATITAGATKYYKVVVRLWIEGEDTTCTSETFANLTDTWALALQLDLGALSGTTVNGNTPVTELAMDVTTPAGP